MIEFNCRKDLLTEIYEKFLEGYYDNLGYYSYDFKIDDSSSVTTSNNVVYLDNYLYTPTSATVGNYYYNDDFLTATHF